MTPRGRGGAVAGQGRARASDSTWLEVEDLFNNTFGGAFQGEVRVGKVIAFANFRAKDAFRRTRRGQGMRCVA